MPPKKTPKIPKFPKKSSPSPSAPTLITANDYLDHGVEEEESGDRWIISDLSKSLRFYQRAYENYIEAINKDSSLVDAYYNANRLLYHVWEVYNTVPPSHLKNVGGCDVAKFSLWEIKEKHEFVVKKFDEAGLTWEMYYNLILINTELIENEDVVNIDAVLKACEDITALMGKVLDYQLIELDSFLKRLENPEYEEEGKEGGKEDNFDVVEQITPSVVLDSIVTGAKFVQASYEFCDNYIQINALKNFFQSSGFEAKLQQVLQLLLSKFTVENNVHDEFNLNFKNEEIEDVKLVNHSISAFFINDFEQLVNHWKTLGNELDKSPSRFMAEADSFQSFKDRIDSITSEQQWVLINHINASLKKAQELVKEELTIHIQDKTNEVSSKVSKIIEILLSRADNELLRSSLQDLESSAKNRDVLRQNTVNLLKSGLNMGNTNCGLRETISDKLKREKLRRECVVRLVVLTKEQFTEQDLIRNLGMDHYMKEVDDLKNNELYRAYFT